MFSDRAWSRVSMAMPAGTLRAMGKLNVPLYRLSRGRLMGTVGKAPVLLLTSAGRRSGLPRTAPVLYMEDGGNLVVIASNAGNAKAPAWSYNLRANPPAEVDIRGRRRSVTARIAEDEERERLWKLMNNEYEGFDSYDERTSRDIDVFVLEPR